MRDRYAFAVGIGIALLTASLMATELILTRIFSVVLWYHFAFFAISVALFGTGAAGLVVHLFQGRLPAARTRVFLARAALLLAIAIVAVDLCLINVTPDWFGGDEGQAAHLTFKLGALFVLAATPFFVGGLTLGLAMTRYSADVDRLYGWDLLGAAAACVLVLPLLAWLGGPGGLLGAALLACGASAALLGWGSRRGARYHRAAVLVVAVAIAGLGVTRDRHHLLEVKYAKGQDLRGSHPRYAGWNSFSQVTVWDAPAAGWALSPAYDGPIPPTRTLVIDLHAATYLTKFDGDLSKVRYTLHDFSALGFWAKPRAREACVIGAGAGKDVLAGLVSGARHVTAIDINPLIVHDVMQGAMARFTGGLYLRPDVTAVAEDGRSYMKGADLRCDVIVISMVDTSAATGTAAFSLTENSLYTVDAFRDFVSRLAPGGVLSVNSTTMPGLLVGARLTYLAREAMRDIGRDPARTVAVVSLPPDHSYYNVMIKPDGFAPADVARLADAVRRLRFRLVYAPGRIPPPLTKEHAIVTNILLARDDDQLAARAARLPLDISPTTDERPFFFYQRRLRDLFAGMTGGAGYQSLGNGARILGRVLLVAGGLALLFLAFPLLLGRDAIRRGHGSPLADVAYVACLGVGFMFVEIALLQRLSIFLGNPTYGLALVLLVLLLAGSAGSRTLSRGPLPALRRRIPLVLLAAVVYALAVGLGGRLVLSAAVSLPPILRAAIAAALVAPLGLLLGAALPAGIRSIGARAPERIPWLWAVNSATSVLGSILAVVVSIHVSITASLGAGALAYAAAALLATRVTGARDDGGQATRATTAPATPTS